MAASMAHRQNGELKVDLPLQPIIFPVLTTTSFSDYDFLIVVYQEVASLQRRRKKVVLLDTYCRWLINSSSRQRLVKLRLFHKRTHSPGRLWTTCITRCVIIRSDVYGTTQRWNTTPSAVMSLKWLSAELQDTAQLERKHTSNRHTQYWSRMPTR